jgi:hypothetical protein
MFIFTSLFCLYCYPNQQLAMRQFYFLFLSLLVYGFSTAQVSVSASAGTPGPSNYTTVKAAFDAINAGTHQGVIAISVTANTTEVATAVLNASGSGSASYTAISLQPSGGTAFSVTGNIAGPLIDLNGAHNVTINGMNTGGNSLMVSNTNNTATASTIRFINDAGDNSITNTTILGAGSSISSASIFFSTGITTGNDNNTISNCNIAEASPDFPTNAILSSGSASAGQENSNNSITGNNISNYFSATLASTAVLIGTGSTDWTITNNHFFQTASRTFTAANTHRVIQVNAGVNYLISGNIIGYATAAQTGTYTLGGAVANRFVAIELTVGTGAASSVQNNTVANIAFTTTSNAGSGTFYGIWCGLYIIAGNVNAGNITANTIGSATGTGNILLSPTVNGAFAVAITSTSTGTVNISNNNIGAIDLLPSGVNAGTLVGIQTLGAGGTTSIINNTVGNTTANNMRIGIAGTTTQSGIIRGIINSNTGTVHIINNTIRNMVHNGTASTALLRGIEYQGGTGNISGNTLSNLSAGGSIANFSTQAGVGILISSTSTGIVVDSNTVYNLTLPTAGTTGAVLSGIYAGIPSASLGIVNGLTITRNRIYNLSNANVATSTTAPAIIAGIFCGNANAANPMTITNNMIALGNTQTTNTAIIGIFSYYATAQNYTARIYHNTVDIEGAVGSGAQPSFAYYRGDFSATASSVPTVDIRNNIFVNNRAGGTGKHYAIANGYPNAASSATGWPAAASDYNILLAIETTFGYWGSDKNFSGWQTASAGDLNSFNPAAVNFVSTPSDLHLVANANPAANNTGTPIVAVTIDIDKEIRSATTPDIGADEFTPPLSIAMEYFRGTKQPGDNLLTWKAGCSSATVVFAIERSGDGKSFKAIGSITATKERCAAPFAFTDAAPADGINYYRLKMTEANGAVTYSAVIAIINRNAGIKIVGMSPSIIDRGISILQLSSAKKDQLDLRIVDMNGKLMIRESFAVIAGSNSIVLNLAFLPAGIYSLQVYAADGSMGNARFVKQ